MIRNVLLDLDDTLFDFRACEHAALTRTLRVLGIEPKPEVMSRYSAINRAQWERLERRELTREQVVTSRYRILFDELGIDADETVAANTYEEHLAAEHIMLDGAEELLNALYGKKRLYIITNGTARVQERRLRESGIGRYFDGIFISQEIGADKPSQAYFNACFARIPEFRIDESIVVGDSLTSDILGGKNAGVRTVWVCPKGREPKDTHGITPDYRIRSVSELETLLKEIE